MFFLDIIKCVEDSFLAWAYLDYKTNFLIYICLELVQHTFELDRFSIIWVEALKLDYFLYLTWSKVVYLFFSLPFFFYFFIPIRLITIRSTNKGDVFD